MDKRRTDKNKIIDGVVFGLLLAAVSAVTLVLFYRQTTGSPERYHSDMKAYILEMQGLDSGYSFPYPIFFKLSAFLNLFASPELAVALATMLLNSLAVVITKLALNHLVLGDLQAAMARRGGTPGGDREAPQTAAGQWLPGVLVSLVSVSLFFISMLYPPDGIYLPGISFKYLGVFTPNPFHNATYMAARPFAILAFLWFVKLLPVYEGGVRRSAALSREGAASGDGTADAEGGFATLRDYILFSVFLLLATMTKPSFTIVLVGTAGLIMLYRMAASRFRNFVPTIQLGLCFVPTFVDLLYQFKGVFVPEEGAEGGIGFCFGEVWGYYCSNLPLAICLAVGFPILVLLLHLKDCLHSGKCGKNSLLRFAWQFYLMSVAMAFFLYEKGFRKPDFNFSWGYMYWIFFCQFGSLVVLMRSTAAEWRERKRAPFLALQWLAYLCHVICGIFYFRVLMSGGMYY